MKYRRKLGWVILFVIAFAGLAGVVTMYLWNWLMPYLFGLPEITFLQTLGILILTKILFGFGKGGWGGKHGHKSHMSPMEKEMIRRKWMEKCGYGRGRESDFSGQESGVRGQEGESESEKDDKAWNG